MNRREKQTLEFFRAEKVYPLLLRKSVIKSINTRLFGFPAGGKMPLKIEYDFGAGPEYRHNVRQQTG